MAHTSNRRRKPLPYINRHEKKYSLGLRKTGREKFGTNRESDVAETGTGFLAWAYRLSAPISICVSLALGLKSCNIIIKVQPKLIKSFLETVSCVRLFLENCSIYGIHKFGVK